MSTPTFRPPVEPVRQRLLREIERHNNLPTLGLSVAKVIEMTSSGDDSVAKLAHFILSDIALTQKILRLANTVEYRSPFSGPVTTVSKAIFLLGFNAIKTSAMAMLLVDGFKDFSKDPMVSKELMHSLCASIVAREMGARASYPDAEEAAVAALFKNISPVLLAAFDPELYKRIQSQIANKLGSPREIVNKQLGCSYERFAEQVMENWKIPETIVQALAPLNSSDYRKAAHRTDWLRQIASFSDAIADQMVLGEPDLPQRCAPVLQRFSQALELDETRMLALLQKVEHDARQLAKSMGISLPGDVSTIVANPAVGAPAKAPLPEEYLLQPEEESAAEIERYPSGKPLRARDLLLVGVQDMTQMLMSEHVGVYDIMMQLLETLKGSLGFRFAAVFLEDRIQQNQVMRISVGMPFLPRNFHFRMSDNNDLFNLALKHNSDLSIADATLSKIQHLLPQWHHQLRSDTQCLLILPLISKHACGLIYADRNVRAEEGINHDETALIKTLKGQLLSALEKEAHQQ